LVLLLDVVLDTEFDFDLSWPDWPSRSAAVLAVIRGLAALAPGAVFTSLRAGATAPKRWQPNCGAAIRVRGKRRSG
jgi:hypothetical protein